MKTDAPIRRHLSLVEYDHNDPLLLANAAVTGVCGPGALRRVLFTGAAAPRTYVEVMGDKAASLGKPRPTRADMRLGVGPNQEIFLLNRTDGIIRVIGR